MQNHSIVNIHIKPFSQHQQQQRQQQITNLIMFCILWCNNKFTTISQQINLCGALEMFFVFFSHSWIETMPCNFMRLENGFVGWIGKNPNGNHKITFILNRACTMCGHITLEKNSNDSCVIWCKIVSFARHDWNNNADTKNAHVQIENWSMHNTMWPNVAIKSN